MRHEVNNSESSVVVQELEFAINRALYGLHCLTISLFGDNGLIDETLQSKTYNLTSASVEGKDQSLSPRSLI